MDLNLQYMQVLHAELFGRFNWLFFFWVQTETAFWFTRRVSLSGLTNRSNRDLRLYLVVNWACGSAT